MSIIKEIFPQCDFCKVTNPDLKGESIEVVQQRMKKAGWKKVSGKDKCSTCLQFGIEGGKKGLL